MEMDEKDGSGKSEEVFFSSSPLLFYFFYNSVTFKTRSKFQAYSISLTLKTLCYINL